MADPHATSKTPAGHRLRDTPGSPPGGQPAPHPADLALTGWRDADGTPIPVRARVEQIGVDAELGGLPSRLDKRGVVLRRSATRLVVRFEGETALARIRPGLVRLITGEGR
jgi:hypothetical protein